MKKKILIIEDDISLRDAINDSLIILGYETAVMESGENIINIINSFSPELILLDLVIPGKDGFEVLEEIKIKNNISIPVVVLSNLNSQDDRKRCSDLGAAKHILKTDYSMKQIGEEIAKFLNNKA